MEYLEECFSSSEDVQMYVPFGNVYMEMLDGTEEISDYHRELCLDTAEVRITYKNQGAFGGKSPVLSVSLHRYWFIRSVLKKPFH